MRCFGAIPITHRDSFATFSLRCWSNRLSDASRHAAPRAAIDTWVRGLPGGGAVLLLLPAAIFFDWARMVGLPFGTDDACEINRPLITMHD